jgi:hypothetical protein
MTRIEKLQQNGIIRLGSPKRGFRYKRSDGGKVSAADLKAQSRQPGTPSGMAGSLLVVPVTGRWAS